MAPVRLIALRDQQRFTTRASNILGSALNNLVAYRQFLDIISKFKRSTVASEQLRLLVQKMFSSKEGRDPGSRPVASEEMEDLNQNARPCLHIRLEIESFYMFAKVFIDIMAKLARSQRLARGRVQKKACDARRGGASSTRLAMNNPGTVYDRSPALR